MCRLLTLLLLLTAPVHAADPLDALDPDALAFGMQAFALDEKFRAAVEEDFAPPPVKVGMLVFSLAPSGPAETAGLKYMDIISTVNRKPVGTKAALAEVVKEAGVSRPLEISYFRAFKAGKKWVWRKASTKATPATVREIYLGAMERTDDPITGRSTYRPKLSASSPFIREEIVPFVFKDPGKKPRVELRVGYVGRNWLFIENCTVKAGMKTFTFPVADRDDKVINGGVAEWFYVPVTEERRPDVFAMLAAPDCLLRLSGDTYKRDREIPRDEIHRIEVALVVAKLLSSD